MNAQDERRLWMSTLAAAPVEKLEQAWKDLSQKPEYQFLRYPETGLIMVRGRAGGSGNPFNLGEMTITRCTVRIDCGKAGCAYIMGRNGRQAELAALFDAMLQDQHLRPEIIANVIVPLNASRRERKMEQSLAASASRVEFFTMVRGE